MILADTHIWLWWVAGNPRLPATHRHALESHRRTGIGVSIISCWEVAKLVQIGRVTLNRPALQWLEQSLVFPGIRLLELTPSIAAASTQLPGQFHRDPADQIIVATAREYDCDLITVDERLLNYPYIRTIAP